MPTLESNLLYGKAQQTKPWRAGTPGRAPRYRRAVVDYRRPLCLFMPKKLLFFALFALFANALDPVPVLGQASRKVGFQVRVGAMGFSPLVEDAVRSRAVADSIDADQSTLITVRQGIAPAIAVAALVPLRGRTELELSAGFATSKVTGKDDFESWDVATVSVGNALFGVSFAYRPTLSVHGAVGITRLFASDVGLFAKGNTIRPLVEAGLSYALPSRPEFQIDARAQTHTFATTSLRDEDAEEGSVFRIVLSGSFSPGRGAR